MLLLCNLSEYLLPPRRKHSNRSDWSQKPLGWAGTLVGKVQFIYFFTFVISFDSLVRDDPIADYFVLYNTPYLAVVIVEVVCCGLRLNYVANRAALEFSWSHRASKNRPYDRERGYFQPQL